MPPDDILLNKAAIIERCVRRIAEEVRSCPGLDNFTHVDALTLNIERGCQAAIDMSVLRWVVDSGHRDWIRLGEALGVAIRP
jgi:hypothetical protein